MNHRACGMAKGAVGGLALALAAPLGAGAATLGLAPQGPSVEATGATIDYLDLGGGGDLSTLGASVDFADGIALAEGAELSFAFGYPTDRTEAATGGFDLTDAGGLVLDGALSRVGYTEDSIELEFGDLGGSAADAFGSSALVTVDFDDALGANPFEGLVDGGSYLAAVTVAGVGQGGGDGGVVQPMPAPIPVPASGALLLTAMALAGVGLRRRRASAQ